MKTIPVILAGGIGERFWPMSRASMPKQLHAIGSDKSMLAQTIERVREVCANDVPPMLVTAAAIADIVRQNIDCDNIEIVAEPQGKNTAPAIALAAAIIAKRHGDATMVVVSADHAIRPTSAFAKSVERAVKTAQSQNALVVFGIKPTRPETGYGYIELGDKVCEGAFVVKRFVEKPNAKTAVEFMERENFLWNSGMFVWNASTILNEFKTHMNDLYNDAMTASAKDFSNDAINEFYKTCCKESIDFGIMEKAKNVCAVCGEFFWDDLGSWESLSRVYEKNALGTTQDGSLIYESECANSLIVNKSGRTLAAVGLQNVAVIAVDDALLVIDRARLPDLKNYLTQIKSSGNFPSEIF